MNSTPMGRDCIKLITQVLKKQINLEQYYIELYELHRKYPMSGHHPPLTKYQMENYIGHQVCDYNGLKYIGDIQPLSFKESAEMLMLHNQRVSKQTMKVDYKLKQAHDEIEF